MHIVSRVVVAVAALSAFAAGAKPAEEAAAAPVQAGTAAADGAGAARKPNPMICERVEEIGSRLRSKKICMLKSEWDEQRRSDRANIERSQVQRGMQPAG